MPISDRHVSLPAKPLPIFVRLQGDENEYVRIQSPLPANPYDLIYLLKVETAPRVHWRDAALAYFREGMWSAGVIVLEQATSDDVDSILRATDDIIDQKHPKCSRLDLLASLAGAHIMAAESEKDEGVRQDNLRKAGDVFSRADKIDLDDPSIWAARGWAEFHAGKSSAVNWFDNAKDKTLVLGGTGLAALQLNRGRPEGKRDVVALLVGALRNNLCPGGVWTGLAYALHKEGRVKAARNVARRAVSAVANQKKERLEALYLVALSESSEKGNQSIEHMVAALREAYLECGGDRDPRVLAMIAEVHFNGGDFETAERFGQRAVEMCEHVFASSLGGMFQAIRSGMKIMALFQLARAQHHLEKLDEAMQGFEEIKKLADSSDSVPMKINIGALLRLGLLKLATGKKEDESLAQECLEKVVKESNERCGIAMRALGVLLGRQVLLGLKRGKPRGGEMYHRAVSLLKKGLVENDDAKKDVPAQLVYAGLIEEASPKLALESYREAIRTMEEENISIDPEVWNNMSSLLGRLGEVEEAEEIATTKIDVGFAKDCKAIEYNRGRLAEMAGNLQKAKKVFRGIAKEHPHYYEAITRLAVIAMDHDERDEAEELLKEAMESSSTRCTAVAFLSMLYARQKKFKQTQEVLETHRHEGDYLALSFSSFMHRFLDSLDQDRRARFLVNHIGTPLINILKRSKRNSFAANGVGVYFAESKMMAEARDAFTAAGAGPFATKTAKVNLAHTQVNLGHRAISDSARVTGRPSHKALSSSRALFEQADKLYRDALEASRLKGGRNEFNSFCELQLYIAWAQFEAREYRESADMLTKLLHLVPTSPVVWFNLGQALLESASIRVAKETPMLKELKIAKDEFDGSKQAFMRCQALDRDQSDPITRSHLDKRQAYYLDRYVRQQAKSHDVKLRNAILAAEDRENKRRESLMILEERKRKKEAMERKAEETRIKKEEELRRSFEESEAKKERYNREQQERELKTEEVVYGDDDPENVENNLTSRKPRGKRKKKEATLYELDEEKPTKKAKKQRKNVKKEEPGDSGSEYSDLNEVTVNGDQNGTKMSHSDNSGGEGEAGHTKPKRFSVADDGDEEASDGGP